MATFREVLEDCEMIDLGFSGQWYTWERGRLVSNNIRERLDRGVANLEWWDPFPGYVVSHLQHSFSNHCPIVVNTNGDGGMHVGRRQWQFRFNVDWILSPEIKFELNFEAHKEEIFWEQRERTNWLRLGEKNTAFFRRSASYCKKKNMVKGLEDESRILVTDIDEMSKMVADYFKDLFSSKEISDCDRLLASFSPCIMEELNRDLMAEFKAEEVVVATKSIAPLRHQLEGREACLDKGGKSGDVDLETQEQVGGILGVRISNNPEKYLGLLTMVGRRKKHAFVDIKERFVKLLNNWSLRFLSAGGKEVSLKSILQAILIYAMQCFKLSISLCRDLENLMCKFWWRNSKTNKGIHWCKRSDMCIPKAKGGLGFKDLATFNLALLAKQGWKIITQPHCLFVRVMKAKYFPKEKFMSAGLCSYPSYTWRSIWGARQLLEEGIGWRDGNVDAINIWNDIWLPGPGSGRIQCQNIYISYTVVSDVINKDTTTWKQDTILSLFGEEQMKSISFNPIGV
ncbi:reverse transcriptase [Gossypium australe]|uniref:Reverse transcriptase n=1 Tax=Gossypium australe TaxID=47621 RepID=A0A5B6U1J0_9ROSI|nr:reverse transcriptase [Gossypium australe]